MYSFFSEFLYKIEEYISTGAFQTNTCQDRFFISFSLSQNKSISILSFLQELFICKSEQDDTKSRQRFYAAILLE
jgi:hypothetical protein